MLLCLGFFFLSIVGPCCPCPYIGFCLLAWLFHSVGWGLAFLQDLLFSYPFGLSAPTSGVNPFVVSRVQKSLVAFVVWVRLYLCIHSCLGTRLWLIFYFHFLCSIRIRISTTFLSVRLIGVYPHERGFFRLSFYHFPLLYPPNFWLYGKAMCSFSGFLFFEKKNRF